jgi:hypothetical protein
MLFLRKHVSTEIREEKDELTCFRLLKAQGSSAGDPRA